MQPAPLLNQNVCKGIEAVRQTGLLNFRSESLPTWCPGCGYYAITHALLKAFQILSIDTSRLVCVSGIGCSGRFPFFLNGYGFHTLHGRPLPVACGIKMADPHLSLLVVGGDGDGLAIGGGHLVHAIRRNVDVVYLLFDNGIYGLTKGQASPTTPQWQKTHTTPYGNPDRPLNPTLLGLAYEAPFVARGYAGAVENMTEIFCRAFRHRGFAFVHLLTPCVTFDEENITYEALSHAWHPLPEGHDVSDWDAAVRLAKTKKLHLGIFYEARQPSWDQTQLQIQQGAGSKNFNPGL